MQHENGYQKLALSNVYSLRSSPANKHLYSCGTLLMQVIPAQCEGSIEINGLTHMSKVKHVHKCLQDQDPRFDTNAVTRALCTVINYILIRFLKSSYLPKDEQY